MSSFIWIIALPKWRLFVLLFGRVISYPNHVITDISIMHDQNKPLFSARPPCSRRANLFAYRDIFEEHSRYWHLHIARHFDDSRMTLIASWPRHYQQRTTDAALSSLMPRSIFYNHVRSFVADETKYRPKSSNKRITRCLGRAIAMNELHFASYQPHRVAEEKWDLQTRPSGRPCLPNGRPIVNMPKSRMHSKSRGNQQAE